MAHDLPPDLKTEIAKPELRPFLGLHLDLPDPVFAVTGNATIAFNGQIWDAIGALGAMDVISEATDGSATGISASLFQIPSEFREDLADQAVRGCLGELFVGVLDFTHQEVIAFKRLKRGTLQGYEITDGGETLSVKVTIDTSAIDQRRPAQKRFTDEWQQRKYPGDLFFQYVAAMAEVPILWAAASQDSTTGGGGGSVASAANVQLA